MNKSLFALVKKVLPYLAVECHGLLVQSCCIALVLLFVFPLLPSLAEQKYTSPAAQLFSESSASEHWELTARFDSGHLLFAEFIVTNIGLGDRNAVVLGHVVTPQGKSHRFTNGRTKSRWTLSSDHLRMEIGASTLDLRAPLYQLRVDKQKVRVNLRFRPDATTVRADSLSTVGYALNVLATGVPVEGTLWLKGMAEPLTVRGSITATHSWMREAGPSLLLRRIEWFSFDAATPLYGIDLTTPHGRQVRWVMVKPQGKSAHVVEHAELELTGADKRTKNPGYTVPRTLSLTSPTVKSHFQLDSVVLRADPLADLPLPVRVLVSALLDFRPQRIWASSPFSLSFFPTDTDPPIKEQGTGVTAISFLNPLPDSFPVARRRSE